MTNRLELSWKLDGVVDEQLYYCSETPINTESPPSPKAFIDSEARSYIDDDVEVDKTYHVCIGAKKGSILKISSQVVIDTIASDPYWSYVSSMLLFQGANNSTAFIDEKGVEWARRGDPRISTTQHIIGGSSGLFSDNNYISTNTISPFEFSASEDFTVEAWVYIPSSATFFQGEIPIICAGVQQTTSDGGGWNLCIFDDPNAVLRLERDNINGTVHEAKFYAGVPVPRDTWIHVEFGRISGTTYGFWQGELKGTTTSQNGISFNIPNVKSVSIGSGNNVSTQNYWHFDGFVNVVRVTKGICRHTSSFTPPTKYPTM
ncbi:LamG-like jellyroll fold domain-containing protein [Acinetobacter thermotolerans]|uniref:LamG-like jellyroll fold domain-containing protein n=1 Tax=Acinetobacter thermotolerans TaxID=3151487 RepID=UPI00325A6210